MALLPQYDTPASLRDAPAGSPFYSAWNAFLRVRVDDNLSGDGGGRFYDATVTDVNIVARKTLTWMGFPRTTMLANRDNKRRAYEQAEDPAFASNRRFQNEYFEWVVERVGGKIKKVTFVTEVPEYYDQLWATNPAHVVDVYRSLVNPAIVQADLASGPGYRRNNSHNTTSGIVHLIQTINNIGAAIGLSEDACSSPAPFRDNFEARPGLATEPTSVDPRVSFDIHMLVRKGLSVTLDDPMGIYIAEWNDSGFSKPDGSPAGNYWTPMRNSTGRVTRLVYEVPAAEGFLVGDMKIGGHPIEFGGQIAEHITVSITGAAGTPA